MSIRALEVRAPSLLRGINVPAPTALVGDQWLPICFSNLLHKARIGDDGLQSIADRQCVSFEFAKRLGEVVISLRGEYQVGCRYGWCHGCVLRCLRNEVWGQMVLFGFLFGSTFSFTSAPASFDMQKNCKFKSTLKHGKKL